MFLSKSLGIASLNPRRLLILSSIISVCVQGKNGQIPACKEIGPDSKVACQSDSTIFAADDGKSNSNATATDKNDITANDLSARAANNRNCAAVGVVFARGTTEPGTVGALVGPPFFNALNSKMGDQKVDVQGVDYPADVPGFLAGGSAKGSAEMARLITESRAKCPDMQLIVSGYSQGCQLVHKATNQLPSDVTNQIGAIVMFGDPLKGTPIKNFDANKVLTVCHNGDLICEGESIILAPHLTYSRDARKAADFSMKTLGAKRKRSYDHTNEDPLPNPSTSLVEPVNPIFVPVKVVKNWNLWKRT